MKKRILFLFLAVQSGIMMFAETTANILTDGSLEQTVAAGEDFEDYAQGQWKYLVCNDNGTTATVTQPTTGHTGKCISFALANVPAADVWSCLLYQDLKSLRPTRYEVLFWIKADKTGKSAVNVTATDKNTNNILAKSSETGLRYSADGWLPCVTYLDLTGNSYRKLKDVRLALHFSEAGTYQIDDISMRPVYDVPFDVTDGTSTLTDYLSFDEPVTGGFDSSWGTTRYSTPDNLADFSNMGGASDYITMRYTNYMERGAAPIEGEHSLYVEVNAVTGSPTYQIALKTKAIAAAADGKKIRLSFWAKSDASTASNPATQQTFGLVPRFAQSGAVRVQLTGEWKKYTYDYDFTTLANPSYRYFRFEFDRVNNYHIDAVTLEYIDLPEAPKPTNVYIHNTTDNTSWKNVTTTTDPSAVVVAADKLDDVPTGDNWFFAPGKYTLATNDAVYNDVMMYGGFSGEESIADETAINHRQHADNDHNGLVENWEFANRVYFQSADALPATAEDVSLTLADGTAIDGISFRNINSTKPYIVNVGIARTAPATLAPINHAGVLRNSVIENVLAKGIAEISDYSRMDGCLVSDNTVSGSNGIYMPGYRCEMDNTKCRNISMAGNYVYFVVPQIAMDGAAPTIENCIFHHITTGKNNYGVIRTTASTGTDVSYIASNIVNCTFSNNSSVNVIEFIGTSGNVANCLINANTYSVRSNSSTATVKAYNCVSNKPFTGTAVTGSNCYTTATIAFNGTVPAAAGYVATTATDYSKVIGSTFSINGYPSDGTTTYYGTGVAGSINVPTTDIMGYAQLNGKYTVGAFNPLTILSENSAANTGSFVDGIAGRVVVSRTLKTGQWGTVYLPLNMTAEQVASIFGTGTKLAAYDETGSTATKLNFKTVAAAALIANTPYIIYPAQDVNNFTLTDVTMVKQTGTPSIGNDKFSFIGSYDKASYTGNECWYIANGNVVKKLTDGGTLKGLSCHFERTTSGAKDLIFTVDDESTGIDNISTDEMKTGDGRIYNILGQQVNSDYRGVVIRNGKKFIKK